MVNYQIGKIYKIVCNITDECYIGSTCEPTLAMRLSKHVACYKRWKSGNCGKVTCYVTGTSNIHFICKIAFYSIYTVSFSMVVNFHLYILI